MMRDNVQFQTLPIEGTDLEARAATTSNGAVILELRNRRGYLISLLVKNARRDDVKARPEDEVVPVELELDYAERPVDYAMT